MVLTTDVHGETWTFKKVVEKCGYPVFSKRVSNAIRTYQHALSEETRQHSIYYITRNFRKYDKRKDLLISDKCCDRLKKEPLRRKGESLAQAVIH